ncbi:MAG: helix-turn-helix domain-containing protein [Patescibacteria group bacterium]
MNYSNEILKGLGAFGLDEKEVKVYLAGLEIGTASVLELSRRTSLPRTTLYPILERLEHQGVFKVGKQKSTKVYIAEMPDVLKRQLDERAAIFSKTLPALETIHGSVHEGPGVTFYEGSDGFKRVWKAIIGSGVKEYRLITSGTGLLDYVKEPYIVKRVIAERMQKKILSKQLIPNNRNTRKIVEKDHEELRESRFLPANISLPSTVIIFADHVAFITTRKENTMILLASGDVALTYKTLFDLIWDKADKADTL